MSPVVAARGLRKCFGRTPALAGLNLDVLAGEVHGLLGPSGAGKTTTLRILLGLLRADGGEARVYGRDPWRDAVTLHERMVFVPGEVEFWPSLTGGEVIDLLSRLHGKVDPGRGTELIEAVRRLSDRGRTVLLSSHVLAEKEALCDRVTIIRDRRSVETGTMAELRHLTRTSIVARLAEIPKGFARLPGVHDPLVDDRTVRCEVDTTALDEVMRALSAAGIRSLVTPSANARGVVSAARPAGRPDHDGDIVTANLTGR